MLETLDDAAVHRWCGGGLAALRAHQHEIDELNVYPVPDGDTGTNLVLTLTSAAEALSSPADAVESGTPLGRAMRRMARGALLGARGNSGVIVSQILRGMADTFAMSVAARGGELAAALRTASEAAYAAVARPVEGTVLSVVAAAAEAAARLKSDDVLAVARAAAKAAREALARTPQQLEVLARAGVVDAGGRGLVVLLDALVDALSRADHAHLPSPDSAATQEGSRPAIAADHRRPRTPGPESAGAEDGLAGSGPADLHRSRTSPASPGGGDRPSPPHHASGQGGAAASRPSAGGETIHSADVDGFGYEVQYLLDAGDRAVEVLKARLDMLGDSLVVVGTGEGTPPTWNVHVHVDDIGAAIEAGIEAGRPHRISVTRLEHRVGEEHRAGDERRAFEDHHHDHDERSHRGEGDAPGGADPRTRGAVVVAAGDGLTALFTAEGAVVVDRNPSIAEMLAAIEATGAGRVVLLPNDSNTLAVATAAAREAGEAGVRVSVVPTRSPVQALAALAVRDSGRSFADDVIAMAEAAGACRYGEVCTAQRESLTVAGRCRPGDLLGLVEGEVHIIGDDLAEVCARLVDRLLGGGGELLTVVLGADVPAGLEAELTAHVARAWPFAEVQSYSGGQPRYHLLVGVE